MGNATVLRITAYVISISQFVLGAAYLFGAERFNELLDLDGAPSWTQWPFALGGARYVAFGFGMLLVARNPTAHRSWIQAMILVQAIDWLATIASVSTGIVTLRQVATASFLPLIFIAGLLIGYPRAPQATTSA